MNIECKQVSIVSDQVALDSILSQKKATNFLPLIQTSFFQLDTSKCNVSYLINSNSLPNTYADQSTQRQKLVPIC